MQNICRHCCTKVEGLNVRINNNLILDNVDLHVDCGEVVAVVGPNGAGKTTLLRTILGEVPYEGQIIFRVGGAPSKSPKIGYVPQRLQFDADSPISVADLVAAATGRHPAWTGLDAHSVKKVKQVLALFSAEHLWDRTIGGLSGGEMQRVLLAIAMTPKPDLLLLDEAVSGVDAKGLTLFYDIVNRLRRQYDIAVILVTHDLAGVASFADRVILLNSSVIAHGSPQEVFSHEKAINLFGSSPRSTPDAGKNSVKAEGSVHA